MKGMLSVKVTDCPAKVGQRWYFCRNQTVRLDVGVGRCRDLL